MSFNTLQLFRDIVQARSVSKGAELNGVTASAASQHLQELERSLGVTLLDRSTRPFTLTDAGRIYNDTCRDILRRWDDCLRELDAHKADVQGTVRVAAIYSIGLSEMSDLEVEFGRRAPQARLAVEYLRPEKIYESVIADRADIGLVSYPEATKELAVIPWRSEEMVIVTAPGHPLTRKSEARPEDLTGHDFVAFDEDLPIRRDVDRYLKSLGVEVNVAMHFDNLQTIKEAVALGAGISIVPERVLGAELEAGRLAAVPLTEPKPYRPLGIIHRKRKRLHRAAQLFLDLLQEPAETRDRTLTTV
jgi:LysR family transcriptional regulator, transcriptional activator of the cysJI operon